MSHLYLSTHPGNIANTIPLNPILRTARWPAKWCCHPHVERTVSSVQLFRKTVLLGDNLPTTFPIHITADQRYTLWVNGVQASVGPARGDLLRWRFETVDIAPFLKSGENLLAVRVHYIAGDLAPLAQLTVQIGLLVQGDTEAESRVNTPSGWKVFHDEAYSFTLEPIQALWTYSVVGPCEQFDGFMHPWNWQSPDFDDDDWADALSTGIAAYYGCGNAETHRPLVPRTIPAMEETPIEFGNIVRSDDLTPPAGFPHGMESLSVPPDTRIVLLFDHGHETCGFPEIVTSGGKGASITLGYAEALILPDVRPDDPKRKGNRNEVGDRVLRGYIDRWVVDGGTRRVQRPLWWRTYRYAELIVQTQQEPLTIEKMGLVYTGYPFIEKATFAAPERPELAEIAKIGWRTARLCAHETYMDCPYYEQLQYAGDTRIQCLVTLFMSGDARLFRNALMQFNDSRIGDGLTQSRYPSRILQVIPPFSLWYVGMVHDYWRYVPGDDPFIKGLIPGLRDILAWFRERMGSDGLLGALEWWNFLDWCPEWKDGVPPGAVEGGSSAITLQYVLALRETADILTHFGEIEEADRLYKEAGRIVFAVSRLCYDRATDRVGDTPQKTTFSQHAAILLSLAESRTDWDGRLALLERVLTDADLTQTTFYFRFYLNRALVAAGMGNRYLETLNPWRNMMAMGLSTWAENPEPTRSDCHAWSSSPNYEFLATVLGVQSHAPGFGEVVIAPHPGTLTKLSGSVPHPNGEITVALQQVDEEIWEAEVAMPPGTSGIFVWKGKESYLPPGTNRRLTLLPPLTADL